MSKNEVELKVNQKVSRSGMLIFLMLLISIGLLLAFMYTAEKSASLKTDNQILTRLMYYDFEYNELVGDSDLMAKSYYEKASLAYEQSDFINSETNCRLARTYYSDSAQGVRDLKANLIEYTTGSHRYLNLINVFVSMLEQDIKTKESMYEACEYLESASRAYERGDYNSGDNEISSMNEKIRAHDEAVRLYNDGLSKLKLELKKLMDE